MGRKSTRGVVRGIANSLKNGRKTISDISKEMDLDRTAISKYIKILNEAGLLVEEIEGTKKFFSFSPNFRDDTYFGLPLTKKAEEQAYSLFYLIRRFWKENSNKRLLRTTAQKIAYEVIKKCNLDIPTGWYIYGGISIVIYDDSKDYTYSGFPKKVETFVKETTLTYSKFDYAFECKNKQYEDEKNELYLLKNEILSIFYSPKFYEHPKNSIYVINKKLRKLFRLAVVPNRKEYTGLIDAFDDLMTDIFNKFNDKQILDINRKIIALFESVWKYIGMFNFKNDLKNDYSEEILYSRFIFDVIQQEDEIVELGTELQSMIPEDEIKDPLKKKLYEALDKIKPLSAEEQILERKKLNKLKKELGLKKFNEYLRKKAGLN